MEKDVSIQSLVMFSLATLKMDGAMAVFFVSTLTGRGMCVQFYKIFYFGYHFYTLKYQWLNWNVKLH